MFGEPRHHFKTLASTNDTLRALAVEGAAEGTVVTANAQTAGRGRKGRAWVSPDAGNLYFSVLLRPHELHPARVATLSPAMGLAVAEGLRASTGVDARLKWPNDVWINRLKVAGLLAESSLAGQALRFVIVGVGVNVNLAEIPNELADIATSLRRVCGEEVDRERVLRSCLEHIERTYRTLVAESFAALQARWNELHACTGDLVRVDTPAGIVEGRAKGVDAKGALILETDDVLTTVELGEVL